jgi:tetratricopeptide (TPR) repeat protein
VLHYGSARSLFKVPVQGSYGIEIKGISLDTLVSIYDRIRYKTWEIGGDLSGTPDSPVVSVRFSAKDRTSEWPNQSPNAAKSSDAVTQLLRDAADKVLADWDPETMIRAYLQEKRYADAERVARAWSDANSSASDPVYYLILASFFNKLHCATANCSPEEASETAATGFEEALALARWERHRLGEPSLLSRLISLRRKSIAYDERDRIEGSIADIESAACAYDLENCDSYLPEAETIYSRLASKYDYDEYLVTNLASVEMLRNEGERALRTLREFEAHHPVDSTFYYRQGAVRENVCDLGGAIDAYRQALRSGPWNVPAQVAFMRTLTERAGPSDSEEAVETYRWLLIIEPFDPKSGDHSAVDLAIDYAWGLWRTNDLFGASAALKTVITRVQPSMINRLADSFLAKGYTFPALDLVQARIAAVGEKEESPQTLFLLDSEAAKIEAAMGNAAEASDYSRKALAVKKRIGNVEFVNPVLQRQDSCTKR